MLQWGEDVRFPPPRIYRPVWVATPVKSQPDECKKINDGCYRGRQPQHATVTRGSNLVGGRGTPKVSLRNDAEVLDHGAGGKLVLARAE